MRGCVGTASTSAVSIITPTVPRDLTGISRVANIWKVLRLVSMDDGIVVIML